MARKYLKGGALNPAWCDEQDAILERERVARCISALSETMDLEFYLQFSEGMGVVARNKEIVDTCSTLDFESEYEEKFNFLKRHSDTEEDLELALKVLGIKW